MSENEHKVAKITKEELEKFKVQLEKTQALTEKARILKRLSDRLAV